MTEQAAPPSPDATRAPKEILFKDYEVIEELGKKRPNNDAKDDGNTNARIRHSVARNQL